MSLLARIASLLSLAALSAAIWFAGPLVVFDEARPLGEAWPRAGIVGAILLAASLYYGGRFLRHRRAQKALEAAIADSNDRNSDAAVLEARMREAVATLKRGGGKRNFLYELPWYVIIGPPGAGKTTALVNSGLKFPLAATDEGRAIQGVGGTRHCDWWFTDDAVLVDTAGRYTTHESDADSDRRSWRAFLATLLKYRPKQPINGVIVALGVDNLTSAAGSRSQAETIRARLREISETLKVDFPVYVLFTKADLIAGFMPYFGSFDEGRRQKVWGSTFRDMTSAKALAGATPAEFDLLANRLAEEVPDRLEEEQDAARRAEILAFGAQFGALRERVTGFLDSVFASSDSPAHATFRGFYFSSGTQEGTPVDQLLGSVARSFGQKPDSHLSGKGKSFFLHDLLSRVVFAEAGWVSRDKAAERRRAILRHAAIAVVVVAALAGTGVFGASFFLNRSLIQSTQAAMDRYRETAAPLLQAGAVSDSDLGEVLGALGAMRDLPVGYSAGQQQPTLWETLGLGQRDRLNSAAEKAYHDALERMMRSRLLLQMEETIRARMADPPRLYEPLKIYLMLGGQAPKTDDELIVAWMRREWERNLYSGPQNRDGRRELEEHLKAMLALDDEYEPVFQLDRSLIESAQRSLGRMTVADRAEALMASSKGAIDVPDFTVTGAAGPEAATVFEAVDGGDISSLRVPGLYTYDGFNGFYLDALSKIATQLEDDRWVIGAGAEQGTAEQELLRLGPELLDRYARDFNAAWNGLLDRISFRQLSADKPRYIALSGLSSDSSPLKPFFEAVARETALTSRTDAATVALDQLPVAAKAEGLARLGIDLPSGKSQNRAGGAFATSSGQNPGASIEAQFRPYQNLVSGRPGQRPIDALVQNLRDIYQRMLTSASLSAEGAGTGSNVQLQISSLRQNATRLPKALARMVNAAADDFEGDAAETTIKQLNDLLASQVKEPCEAIVADRFPFARGANEDVRMDEFARLFAPGGILDRFFAQNVSSLADTSGQSWEWKQTSRAGRELSKTTLQQFQRASEIRDAFFPLGGAVPAVNVIFTPSSLNGDADQALLNVNGQLVPAYQTGNTPGTVTWPGTSSGGLAQLDLLPEMPGRQSSLQFKGPWALKRLLDAGTLTQSGDKTDARFVIGGRDVAYTIQANTSGNPFGIAALSSFACPAAF